MVIRDAGVSFNIFGEGEKREDTDRRSGPERAGDIEINGT